jgi:hypothetical protein
VLYVANLGDSRVVLGRGVDEDKKKKVVAERLSTDHNVAVEEVRKEVQALHPDDSHIVVYTRGVWRIKGIIQVKWLLVAEQLVFLFLFLLVSYENSADWVLFVCGIIHSFI